jgi:hypothetical protein
VEKELMNECEDGDALIIVHKKFGFVRAWAQQDYKKFGGDGLAIFKVAINSDNMPGIHEMTVNTNEWDIYHDDDPVVLKMIMDKHVPLWLTR